MKTALRVLAVAVVVLVAGCSDGSRAIECSSRDRVVACVLVGDGDWAPAERLSEVNVATGEQGADTFVDEADLLRRLTPISLRDRPFVFAVGPTASLQDLEVWIFESTDRLDTPVMHSPCLPECDDRRLVAGSEGDRTRIDIDSSLITATEVIVLTAFVQSPDELGAVSWGFEVRP